MKAPGKRLFKITYSTALVKDYTGTGTAVQLLRLIDSNPDIDIKQLIEVKTGAPATVQQLRTIADTY